MKTGDQDLDRRRHHRDRRHRQHRRAGLGRTLDGPARQRSAGRRWRLEQMKAKMAARAELHISNARTGVGPVPEQKPAFRAFGVDMKAACRAAGSMMAERRAAEPPKTATSACSAWRR